MLDEAVLEADDEGVPVWHGVLYDITERKRTEAELQRALAQQAVVAKLGERALQDGDPESLMRAAIALIGEVDGVHSACIWELGRDGRRLNLRAGLEDEVVGAGRRVSAALDSHAGAALESGAHTIVSDWASESRFTMPPVLRVVGAASSLAVMIDGKDQPFGVLDVHATEPDRFNPKDVPFVQAAANVLADAIERHAADQALRHRVLHDSLTGLPEPAQLRRRPQRLAQTGDRLRLADRDPLPRPRPLQADQRQPRPPRRRRPAAGGGAAPARPPAARATSSPASAATSSAS